MNRRRQLPSSSKIMPGNEFLFPILFPEEGCLPHDDPALREVIYRVFDARDFYKGTRVSREKLVVDHVLLPRYGGPDNIYNYVLSSTDIINNRLKPEDHKTIDAVLGALYLVRVRFAEKVMHLLGITRQKQTASERGFDEARRLYVNEGIRNEEMDCADLYLSNANFPHEITVNIFLPTCPFQIKIALTNAAQLPTQREIQAEIDNIKSSIDTKSAYPLTRNYDRFVLETLGQTVKNLVFKKFLPQDENAKLSGFEGVDDEYYRLQVAIISRATGNVQSLGGLKLEIIKHKESRAESWRIVNETRHEAVRVCAIPLINANVRHPNMEKYLPPSDILNHPFWREIFESRGLIVHIKEVLNLDLPAEQTEDHAANFARMYKRGDYFSDYPDEMLLRSHFIQAFDEEISAVKEGDLEYNERARREGYLELLRFLNLYRPPYHVQLHQAAIRSFQDHCYLPETVIQTMLEWLSAYKPTFSKYKPKCSRDNLYLEMFELRKRLLETTNRNFTYEEQVLFSDRWKAWLTEMHEQGFFRLHLHEYGSSLKSYIRCFENQELSEDFMIKQLQDFCVAYIEDNQEKKRELYHLIDIEIFSAHLEQEMHEKGITAQQAFDAKLQEIEDRRVEIRTMEDLDESDIVQCISSLDEEEALYRQFFAQKYPNSISSSDNINS